MADGPALVVPTDVEALCVTASAGDQSPRFVGPAADFSQLPVWDETDGRMHGSPLLGDSVERFAGRSIEPGVHLHWALPEGLVHGRRGADGRIRFPAAPNRWLVTRIGPLGDDGAPLLRSWIVESDRVSFTSTAPDAVSIPFWSASADQYHAYVGTVLDYSNGWSEPGDDGSFKQITGEPLTAVGYGDPAFAAFYPSCRNVFGFHDDLTTLPDSGADATLSYLVVGWYSSAADDPLSRAPVDPAENSFRWTFSADGESPRRTLCSGVVRGVRWQPHEALPPRRASDVDVAIGENGPDCLAALLAARPELAGDTHAEFLLNAVQRGLLADLMTRPDWLVRLDQVMHAERFRATPGGTAWTLTAPESDQADGRDALDATAERRRRELSPEAGRLLHELTRRQDAYDARTRDLAARRRQLAIDWQRYVTARYHVAGRGEDAADTAQPGVIDEVLDATRDFITAGAFAITGDADDCGVLVFADGGAVSTESHDGSLAAAVAEQVALVEAQLASDGGRYRLVPAPAARYFEPNEPVVLLSGDDVQPPARYGGVRRGSGTLACRRTAEILAGPDSTAAVSDGSFGALPCGDDALALLREELLLQRLATGASREGVSGVEPPDVGVTVSDGDAWVPLYMRWEVDYQPLANVGDGPRDRFATRLVTGAHELSDNGVDLVPHSAAPARGPLRRYSGTVTLSPAADVQLRQQVDAYLETSQDAEMADVAGQLKLSPMLSQTLGGLNEALLMRHAAIQMPVDDPLADPLAAADVVPVARAVGDANRVGALPLESFSPIRAGQMRLVSLDLIDAFGQVREIELSSERTVIAESLVSADPQIRAERGIQLQPRIVQPARLAFRWLSGLDDGVESGAHPDTSPVCGWLLPNRVDDALAVYDADGAELGTLAITRGEARWHPSPRAGGALEPDGDAVAAVQRDIANPHLRDVALGVLGHRTPDAYLDELIRTVDAALGTIVPAAPRTDAALGVLIGRPVAVVRASVRLELDGPPAPHLGWASLRREVDAGPGSPRDTRQHEKVRFEVRIGDLRSVDDGVVGYYMETGSSADYERFYSHAPLGDGVGVADAASRPISTSTDPAAPDQRLTLLVDPHAAVHAATGILPVKELTIEPHHYQPALEAMAVSFAVQPTLRPATGLSVPLPGVHGVDWSWLQVTDDKWTEEAFDGGAAVSDASVYSYTPQRIDEGVLRMRPKEGGSG
jgi:hypothetical protein